MSRSLYRRARSAPCHTPAMPGIQRAFELWRREEPSSAAHSGVADHRDLGVSPPSLLRFSIVSASARRRRNAGRRAVRMTSVAGTARSSPEGRAPVSRSRMNMSRLRSTQRPNCLRPSASRRDGVDARRSRDRDGRWKCQTRVPVSARSATTESAEMSPGFSSEVFVAAARRLRPGCASIRADHRPHGAARAARRFPSTNPPEADGSFGTDPCPSQFSRKASNRALRRRMLNGCAAMADPTTMVLPMTAGGEVTW